MADLKEIHAYLAELEARAKESQADARRTLNPLFDGEQGRPPRDFVPSSFLYIRSCDADTGSRPVACPQFWLSPDVRVAPLSNVGAPTRQLHAGHSYRFTAAIRNRGDLPVPSAKVEFFLCNPTLGWDTRFATKLGVGAARVQAHGASEVAIDYTIPPSLSGHRCLFVRAFSFAPLDLPVDDFVLDPTVDRHVAQLNLDIVGQATTLTLDWVHRRNAAERVELVAMEVAGIRALRVEAVTALTLVREGEWSEALRRIELGFEPGEGPAIDVKGTSTGLELMSRDADAVELERQVELTKEVLAALRALEHGRGEAARYRELFKTFREMTAQTVRSTLTLALPDLDLKPGEAIGVNVVKHDLAAGRATGGVGLFIAGAES